MEAINYLQSIGGGLLVAVATAILLGPKKAAGLPGGSLATGGLLAYQATNSFGWALIGALCGLIGWALCIWLLRIGGWVKA